MTVPFNAGTRDEGVLKEMAGDPYGLASLPGLRTVLDVGANIGGFSRAVAILNPLAFIAAYEPDPANYALLLENTHHIRHRMAYANLAVWGHDNGVNFTSDHSTSHVCHDAATCIASSACHSGTSNTLRVASITLDQVATTVSGPISLLKVDTEGGEYAIFKSASDATLSRVEHLRMEIHDYFGDGPRTTLWNHLSQHFSMTEREFTPGRGGIWMGDK